MMRDKDDKTRLSYWFPKIENAGFPVPKTMMVNLDDGEAMEMGMAFFGEAPATAIQNVVDMIHNAAVQVTEDVGDPFFLRTDFTSAKHGWKKTCAVTDWSKVRQHLYNIWEFSECAGMIGLP